jgi:hypothetical protein
MTTEPTEQGDQYVVPGAEHHEARPTDRQLAERRMVGRTKKPQKPFESTPLFGGLEPHQDSLF